MSDYLANLLARSQAPADAIRPRLPSLFEPLPAGSGPHVPADPTDFEAGDALPFDEVVEAGDTGPLPARSASPSAAPRQPLAAPGVPQLAVGPGDLVAPPKTAPDAAAAASAARPSLAVAPPPPLPAVQAPIAPSLVPHPLPAAFMQPSLAAPGAAPSRRAAPGAAPSPVVPAARQGAGSPAGTGMDEAAAAGPNIQVHIGRIDVRAVATPVVAARAAPARPAPALSLDAYLQARDRGER